MKIGYAFWRVLQSKAGQKFTKLTVAALLCVLFSIFYSGCASSSKIIPGNGAANFHARGQENVVVEVVSDVPNSDQERKLLHALISSGLQQSGKFTRVSSKASAEINSPHLTLTAKITQLNKVSDGSRIIFGAAAGQASLTVDVQVLDQPGGGEMNTFKAHGKSSAGTAMAGGTDQAVRRAAEAIVAEFLK